MFRVLTFILFASIGSGFLSKEVRLTDEPRPTAEILSFSLNGTHFSLQNGITPRPIEPSDDAELVAQQAEEESSLFLEQQAWIQIIRQDALWNPTNGIGIGFSYPVNNDTFPYIPEKVAIQFKDFQFGGTHFSPADTANFSGIFNNFSADIRLKVIEFQTDTIEGIFSGVLISGSGRMAYLEEGRFKVRLYRR
jgi:hypothetical protein